LPPNQRTKGIKGKSGDFVLNQEKAGEKDRFCEK